MITEKNMGDNTITIKCLSLMTYVFFIICGWLCFNVVLFFVRLLTKWHEDSKLVLIRRLAFQFAFIAFVRSFGIDNYKMYTSKCAQLKEVKIHFHFVTWMVELSLLLILRVWTSYTKKYDKRCFETIRVNLLRKSGRYLFAPKMNYFAPMLLLRHLIKKNYRYHLRH